MLLLKDHQFYQKALVIVSSTEDLFHGNFFLDSRELVFFNKIDNLRDFIFLSS